MKKKCDFSEVSSFTPQISAGVTLELNSDDDKPKNLFSNSPGGSVDASRLEC